MKRDKCVRTMRRDSTPAVRSCTHFGWSLIPPTVAYALIIDGLFLNQKHIKTFEYTIH